MIAGHDPYVMEMASLPALGPLLGTTTPAISATRLEERLRNLAPEDRADLDALDAALSWDRIDLGESDAAFVAAVTKVVARAHNETLRAALRDRLEIRTLIAALHRRHRGGEAPAHGEAWGYGRFTETIRTHWAVPDFGVGHSFPWVNKARERLEAGDTAGLERVILQAAWDAAGRYGDGHIFDFEAVALYVLRWRLADRWARYDVAAATTRFAALLDAARDAGQPSGIAP